MEKSDKSTMELVNHLQTLDLKPRSLQLLDQAYDPSTFKFSQIIRYIQDQYLYHQDLTIDPYDPSTSPLPVDPKLAYDIHTGRYMRRFKTQGSTIVGHNSQGVVKLPYPPRVPNVLSQSDSPNDLKLPRPVNDMSRSVPTRNDATQGVDTELKTSHNVLRKQVWRLPSHVSAFNKGKHKPPLKLPPITVSKLMNGIR